MTSAPAERDTGKVSRSGKALPSSERGQRTRQALLAAARRIFAEQGYAEPTAATIAAAAGVSYGSFYVYFVSKQDIFSEIAEQLIHDVYVATRAPLGELDPATRLDIENRRYFAVYRDNSVLFQLVEEVVRTDEQFRLLWTELRNRSIARVAKSLRRLQAVGRVDPDLDPDVTATVLGGMAERAAYLSTVDSQLDLDILQKTLSTLWSNALGLGRPTSQENP
jgi:AcrR family transcriptional regulator